MRWRHNGKRVRNDAWARIRCETCPCAGGCSDCTSCGGSCDDSPSSLSITMPNLYGPSSLADPNTCIDGWGYNPLSGDNTFILGTGYGSCADPSQALYQFVSSYHTISVSWNAATSCYFLGVVVHYPPTPGGWLIWFGCKGGSSPLGVYTVICTNPSSANCGFDTNQALYPTLTVE